VCRKHRRLDWLLSGARQRAVAKRSIKGFFEQSELILPPAAKMGEGERRAGSWAQRAPCPRALAQSPNCCEAQKMGEGGVSGACAPRAKPNGAHPKGSEARSGRGVRTCTKARTRKWAFEVAKRSGRIRKVWNRDVCGRSRSGRGNPEGVSNCAQRVPRRQAARVAVGGMAVAVRSVAPGIA
jgi:hypothetical protein